MAKFFDLSIGQRSRFEAFERALFVRSHQPRISLHIGGEDRGKTAGRGHGSGSPPPMLSLGAMIHHNSLAATCASKEVVGLSHATRAGSCPAFADVIDTTGASG